MKKLLLSVFIVGLVSWLVTLDGAQSSAKSAQRGTVVHMVAFKFKPEATPQQIKQVEEAFCALKQKVPQIVTLEWGTNISPEKLNKDFTHGFLLTFHTEKDRDAYLVHPDHQAFGGSLGPVLGDVFVLDFKAKN